MQRQRAYRLCKSPFIGSIASINPRGSVLRASTPTAFSNTDTSKLQAQLHQAVSDTSAPSVQERGVTSPQASQRDESDKSQALNFDDVVTMFEEF